tara:strand:- start:800 stop:1249 length:450 start_codon:yes stop_codon:yes gene_type:complete
MHDKVIVINSRVAFNGAVNANQTYLMDFSTFDKGTYSVSMSYVGESNALNADKTCSIYTNLGSSHVLAASDASTSAQTSAFLGVLKTRLSGSTTYLSCDIGDNASICVERPSTNTIEIQMRDGNNAIYTDSASAELANYIMTLRFTKID